MTNEFLLKWWMFTFLFIGIICILGFIGIDSKYLTGAMFGAGFYLLGFTYLLGKYTKIIPKKGKKPQKGDGA